MKWYDKKQDEFHLAFHFVILQFFHSLIAYYNYSMKNNEGRNDMGYKHTVLMNTENDSDAIMNRLEALLNLRFLTRCDGSDFSKTYHMEYCDNTLNLKARVIINDETSSSVRLEIEATGDELSKDLEDAIPSFGMLTLAGSLATSIRYASVIINIAADYFV